MTDYPELIEQLRSHGGELCRDAANVIEAQTGRVETLQGALTDAISRFAAPGHTDLMVSPESIDAFLEANPPPDPAPADVAGLIDWAQDLAAGMYENGGDADGDQMIAIANALARLSRDRDEWKSRAVQADDITRDFRSQVETLEEAAEARLQGVGEPVAWLLHWTCRGLPCHRAFDREADALHVAINLPNDSSDVRVVPLAALAAPARDAGEGE